MTTPIAQVILDLIKISRRLSTSSDRRAVSLVLGCFMADQSMELQREVFGLTRSEFEDKDLAKEMSNILGVKPN